MTEYEPRPRPYRVECPCGYTRRYASEATAKAIRSDHAEQCPNTPELHEEEIDGC